MAAFAPSKAGDEQFREWWARLLRLAASPQTALANIRIAQAIDVRSVLPSIRVSTLVIHRTGDRMVRVENGRYLAEHIPGARYVELPGEDHFPFAGDTDVVLEEIQEFLTGVRPVRDPDRVLATVMFSDIVGSTERAAALGDSRWRGLLENFYGLARKEIERYRGREVKTMGDGFLAMFDGPARAIRCAVGVAGAARPLGIELRAGLHTGECELIGDDVGGIAVHIAQRVQALADPGEVLVSSTVRDLVVGSGIEFGDRGTRELKGVPGEWRLFSVAV